MKFRTLLVSLSLAAATMVDAATPHATSRNRPAISTDGQTLCGQILRGLP